MTASAQQESAEEADEKTTVDNPSAPESNVAAAASGDGAAPDGDAAQDGNDGEWGEGRISVDDADRFAAQFRPSWESIDDDGGWGASPDAPSDMPAGQAPAEGKALPAPAAEASVIVDDEPTDVTPQPAAPEPAPPVVIAPIPTAPNPSAFDAVPDPVALPAKSNRNVFLALGGAAVLLIVVIGAVVASGGDPEPAGGEAASPPSESATESEPAPEQDEASEATANAAGAVPPAPVAEPDPQITVAIRTEPSTAQLTLDGRRVDNPYEASLEPSGTHIVLATAEGFEGRREEVRFTENVDLTLALDALAPAAEPTPPPTMAVAVAATMRRPAPRMTARMRRAPAMMRRAAGGMMRSRMGFTTANPY